MENKHIIARYLIGTVAEYAIVLFIIVKAFQCLGYILEWICNHTPAWITILAPVMIIIIAMGFLILDGSVERESQGK